MAGDYFDTAQSQNDTAKAALLEAIRTQGSQAKAAFDQAQQQVAAQKQQALAAALQDSARRGAPQAMQDQVSSTISAPYDRQLSDLSASEASRAQSFDQTGARAGAYLTEANASLPVLRERQAEQKATLEHQLASQLASQQAAAARSSAAAGAKAAAAAKPPGADTILGDQFGGKQGFLDYVAGIVPEAQQRAQTDYNTDLVNVRQLGAHGNLAARGEANLSSYTAPTGAEIADRVGTSVGLPEGLGAGFYSAYAQQQAAKDAQQAGTATSVRADDGYGNAANELLAGVQAGATTDQIAGALTAKYGTDVARQVMSDYSRVLPSKPRSTTTTTPTTLHTN